MINAESNVRIKEKNTGEIIFEDHNEVSPTYLENLKDTIKGDASPYQISDLFTSYGSTIQTGKDGILLKVDESGNYSADIDINPLPGTVDYRFELLYPGGSIVVNEPKSTIMSALIDSITQEVDSHAEFTATNTGGVITVENISGGYSQQDISYILQGFSANISEKGGGSGFGFRQARMSEIAAEQGGYRLSGLFVSESSTIINGLKLGEGASSSGFDNLVASIDTSSSPILLSRMQTYIVEWEIKFE